MRCRRMCLVASLSVHHPCLNGVTITVPQKFRRIFLNHSTSISCVSNKDRARFCLGFQRNHNLFYVLLPWYRSWQGCRLSCWKHRAVAYHWHTTTSYRCCHYIWHSFCFEVSSPLVSVASSIGVSFERRLLYHPTNITHERFLLLRSAARDIS